MRKLYVFLALFIFLTNGFSAYSQDKSNDSLYDLYMEEAKSYGYIENTDNSDTLLRTGDVIHTQGERVLDDLKSSMYIFVIIIIVHLLSSVLNSFVSNGDLADIAQFSCYCISATLIVLLFKSTADICKTGIDDITDFMSVSIPTFAGLLANSGYVSTATSLQMNFSAISLFLTGLINNIVIPLLYCCGLLSVVDGLTKTVNINNFIALIRKVIKYIIGISLTVFASILALSGFSSATSDNLAMKTAKYAVSNFVPVVGACLSEALNSVVNSSLVLKNNIGIIGFITVLGICFYPIVKTAVYVFVFKVVASVLQLMSPDNMAKVVDSTADVLEMMMGIMLIITVVFILITTIIVSVGA